MATKNKIDLGNREQVKKLIERVKANITIHIRAYEKYNDGSITESVRKTYEERSNEYMTKVENELAPLGINCSWPGLYPSYEINGHSFHNISYAIQEAALMRGIEVSWTPVDVMGKQ